MVILRVPDQDVPLKLEHGRFKLLRAQAEHGWRHFARWYTNHAHSWLSGRVESLAIRVGVAPRGIEVRYLGYRWASCSKHGVLKFHWAVIQLPPGVIEYLAVHELVHLLEGNHNRNFWRRIERVVPDFEKRRRWLAENGAKLTALSPVVTNKSSAT